MEEIQMGFVWNPDNLHLHIRLAGNTEHKFAKQSIHLNASSLEKTPPSLGLGQTTPASPHQTTLHCMAVRFIRFFLRFQLISLYNNAIYWLNKSAISFNHIFCLMFCFPFDYLLFILFFQKPLLWMCLIARMARTSS